MAEATTSSRRRRTPASRRPRYVQRFTLTERLLHWVHASAFFVLLGSGLDPLPPGALDRRRAPTADQGRPLLDRRLVGGRDAPDRAARQPPRADARTIREIDLFDRDDRRFLRGRTCDSPQGRFNAGQKVNAIVTAAFATLFFVSGLLLWLGERNTDIRLGGTLYLHDALMYLSVVIVVGHLYLALINRSTRHALRGMTLGTVREDWARAHHSKWRPQSDEPPALPAQHGGEGVGRT